MQEMYESKPGAVKLAFNSNVRACAWLEGGVQQQDLCVHMRGWVAGGWGAAARDSQGYTVKLGLRSKIKYESTFWDLLSVVF